MKVCEICGDDIDGKRDGDNRCDRMACQNAPEVEPETTPKPFTFGAVLASKKKRKPHRKSARDEAMESLGLVKVRGALGGVYWE